MRSSEQAAPGGGPCARVPLEGIDVDSLGLLWIEGLEGDIGEDDVLRGGWSGGAAALVPQASAQPPPTQPHEPAGRKDALEMLREWKRQEALAAQNQ